MSDDYKDLFGSEETQEEKTTDTTFTQEEVKENEVKTDVTSNLHRSRCSP